MGRHREAPRLFGAAQQLRDETGYRRCVSERDTDLDALRSALGDDAFYQSYDEGCALTLDEAIAYDWESPAAKTSPPKGPGNRVNPPTSGSSH
jgi:hypothetical protein